MPSPVLPLRIFVDLEPLSLGGANGGIKPSLKEMYLWLGSQPEQPFEFIYLCRSEMQAELQREWMRPNDRLVLAENAPSNIAQREGAHLTHCGFGTTNWLCPGIPAVLIISDLLHCDYPDSLSPEDIEKRDQRFRTAAIHADLFQVVSDYTGARLMHHYGISPDRILRTYHPIHDRFVPRSSTLPSNTPYFFYPANAWPHKNHKTLLVAYALYRHSAQQAGVPVWPLVLTGTEDAAMQEQCRLAHTLGLDTHFEFKGFVDEATLAQLWEQAGALVFPSLHEGFGNPLVEAMHHSVPILASDATAIPEVCADAALLVDGKSPSVLAQGMQQIANDAELRHTLIERGKIRSAQLGMGNEFGKLIPIFQKLASASATRKPPRGYYHSDKLTGPLALFSLPIVAPPPLSLSLYYEIAPLGVPRTLEIYADKQHLDTLHISADAASSGQISLPANSQVISLHAVDAARVSEADTRLLGVRLITLEVHTSDGSRTDLIQTPFADAQ